MPFTNGMVVRNRSREVWKDQPPHHDIDLLALHDNFHQSPNKEVAS